MKKSSEIKKLKEEEKELKKEVRKGEILLILAFVMIAALSLYLVFRPKTNAQNGGEILNNTNNVVYNNFTFTFKEGFWYTEVKVDYFYDEKEFEVPFYYNPYEVQDIEMRRGLEYLFMDKPYMLIAVDPDYDPQAVIAGTEISKILGKVWFKKVQAGLTRAVEGSDFPVITCQNISKDRRVIELRLGNETKIFQEEGCIIVQGTDEEELVRAADRLAYRLLKIM
jgi:hypothetical protein